jgi:ariadne-1
MDSDYSDYDASSDVAEEETEEEVSMAESDDYAFDGGAAFSSKSKAQYAVLKRDDLIARQQKTIAEVTSVLGLNDDEAARVLRRFKWDANRVNEEWFSDVEAVRRAVGLLEEPAPETPTATRKVRVFCCVRVALVAVLV